MTFVDLAGSENLDKTGAEGRRKTEGIHINMGLFHLGQVINSLADEQKRKKGEFVNYRNSNLTLLLKDALGGNSQTIFLACVTPSVNNESETLSTLNYAKQARNIQNKPVLKMDNAQQERRYLKYCVKAWTLKAIKQKFGELHSNESAVNGMCSPLPSLSPMPTRGGVVPSEHNDLSAIMRRPDVIAYVNAVEKSIEEKLQNCRNTPKTVRRLIAERSPYTIKTPIKGNHRIVAKRLNMSSNKKKDKKKVAWGSTPERAGGRGMSAIEEDTDDKVDTAEIESKVSKAAVEAQVLTDCTLRSQLSTLEIEVLTSKDENKCLHEKLLRSEKALEASNEMLLVSKEHSASLQEALDKIESEKANKLKGEMRGDKAALLKSEELAINLQKSLDEMAAEKLSLHCKIIELEKTADAHKVDADELSKIEKASNDRILVLKDIIAVEHGAYVSLQAQLASLQETQDELLTVKQIADNRIAELDNQMIRKEEQMKELAAEMKSRLAEEVAAMLTLKEQFEEDKVVSDGYVSNLQTALAEEVAAVLILKNQVVSLQETLVMRGSDQTDSFDHIAALESQVTVLRLELNELVEMKSARDARIAVLEGKLKVVEKQSANLKMSLNGMVAEKMVLENQIVELVEQVEADKVNADELFRINARLDDRIAELELFLAIGNEPYFTLQAQMKSDQTASSDRIDELESQLSMLKIQSDELVQSAELKKSTDKTVFDNKSLGSHIVEVGETEGGNKGTSNGYIVGYFSRLAEEEAVVLVLNEQSARLQESLDKMTLDQTTSLDRIAALESQVTLLYADNNSRVAELKGRLHTHKAALQKAQADSSIAKQVDDDRIVELQSQMSDEKRSHELAKEIMKRSHDYMNELKEFLHEEQVASPIVIKLLASMQMGLVKMVTSSLARHRAKSVEMEATEGGLNNRVLGSKSGQICDDTDIMDMDECDRESQEFDYNDGVMDNNDGDENNNDIDHNRYDDVGRKECTLDRGKGKKKVKTVKKKGSGGLGFPHTPYSQENIYAHANWLILEKIHSDGYTGDQLKCLLRVRNLKVSGNKSELRARLNEFISSNDYTKKNPISDKENIRENNNIIKQDADNKKKVKKTEKKNHIFERTIIDLQNNVPIYKVEKFCIEL